MVQYFKTSYEGAVRTMSKQIKHLSLSLSLVLSLSQCRQNIDITGKTQRSKKIMSVHGKEKSKDLLITQHIFILCAIYSIYNHTCTHTVSTPYNKISMCKCNKMKVTLCW